MPQPLTVRDGRKVLPSRTAPSRRLTSATTWAALALAALALPASRARAQWVPLTSGTNASLRGLSVVDGRTAWASGTRGTVIHTTDGGATWAVDTVAGAAAFDLRSVHARSARVAHVAATAGRIWRTTDGGKSWSLRYQARDTAVFLDAIAFWDDANGIALGDPIGGRFFLLVTRDGGDSWREAPFDERPIAERGEAAFAASGSSLLTLGSADSLVALIGSGGSVARLHRSTNRLRQWVAYDTPIRQGESAAGIFSVAEVPGHGIMVVGGHYAQDDSTRGNAATTVSGPQWRLIDPKAPRGYRSGVAFVQLPDGARIGIAVGPAGSDISLDSGVQWGAFDTVGYHAVRASRDGIFYASGSGGRVGRFDARSRRTPK
ncbi:MAG: hypothetical protein IT359_01610 [Gemmatimonadaceae bacterium]|nr:hypothetical protein [Gemmatimonadaceae bacterium]